MKGIVKWYNARKGYGFITPDDNSDDVFIHATALKDSGLKKLYTGSEVSFEVDQDDKGKRAKSIKVTKEVKPEQIKKEAKEDVKKKEVKTEKHETKKDIKKEAKEDVKKKEVKTEKHETKKDIKEEAKKDTKKEKKKPKKKTGEKKKGSTKK